MNVCAREMGKVLCSLLTGRPENNALGLAQKTYFMGMRQDLFITFDLS